MSLLSVDLHGISSKAICHMYHQFTPDELHHIELLIINTNLAKHNYEKLKPSYAMFKSILTPIEFTTFSEITINPLKIWNGINGIIYELESKATYCKRIRSLLSLGGLHPKISTGTSRSIAFNWHDTTTPSDFWRPDITEFIITFIENHIFIFSITLEQGSWILRGNLHNKYYSGDVGTYINTTTAFTKMRLIYKLITETTSATQ